MQTRKPRKIKRQLLVQIDNLQFNKSRANHNIDLRRILEENMLKCGEYINCEKYQQKN